jgi:hypothetical protein
MFSIRPDAGRVAKAAGVSPFRLVCGRVVCQRGHEAILPSRGVTVLGQPGAGGFGLTSWIAEFVEYHEINAAQLDTSRDPLVMLTAG